MNRRLIHPIMLVLFVSMMTNTFSGAFNGELFAHELDHKHHVLSVDPTAHLEVHHHNGSSGDTALDPATHLLLHASGAIFPFFL